MHAVSYRYSVRSFKVMLPYITIFKKIPSYGVLTAIGVIFSFVYLKIILRGRKELEADAELAYVYGAVGAFVGAKLLSLAGVFPEFVGEIQYLFSNTALFLQKYLYGGFVFYGGLYGALFAVWLYCRAYRVSFPDLAGILLPVLTLIHCFGRVGCFAMGCCYGIPSERFGIVFRCSEIAPNNVPLFPVQLVEAGIVFILFVILAYRAFHKRNGKNSLGIYLCTYAIARFFLEFLRGDYYRGFIGFLSLSQVISVCSFILGLLILMRNRINFKYAKRKI